MRKGVIFGIIMILVGTSSLPSISGQKLLPDGLDADFCFKTYGYNEIEFYVMFGFVTINGTIDMVWDNFPYGGFICQNISQVTVFGIGSFIPEPNFRFYKNTFTNVTHLGGETLKRLEVSKELQLFTTFSSINHPCFFTLQSMNRNEEVNANSKIR
jgi:hypothetical protein